VKNLVFVKNLVIAFFIEPDNFAASHPEDFRQRVDTELKTGDPPMRFVLIAVLALSVTGCTRWSMDHHLNNAYSAYERGNCEQVMLELSKVERASRARPYVWPEVSMMRGQCLEREKMFVDAVQTYQFIIASYPQSEYAYRARARLETLQSLGHYPTRSAAVVRPTQF
jgi:hypothetical protein